MNKTAQKAPQFRFLTTFVLPGLLVFLIPVLSFFFFRHAQDQFDSKIRESILSGIRANQTLTKGERADALAYFTETPFSQLVLNEEVAAKLPADTRFHYATFRWMIVLSAGSVLVGVAVFLLAGVCVALSFYSPFVQYLSLAAGWHVLRIYGALQTVAQGVLLVALSFWLTALWFNFYSVKLILVAGVLAVVGVGAVIAAIFRRVNSDFVIAGRVIAKDEAAPLWEELRRICDKVGTQVPDQIIAGIDDNYFVTEREVIVGGKPYRGRTLFVSLALLKHLHGTEADAVLAHEMAHFSGQDTLYSGKIAPLLSRYNNYLQALHGGVVTLPIYYFMLCFRALYELSLTSQSRQREYRADRIAVAATSARDVAGALLRTTAYSQYRGGLERDLFAQERALETANVAEKIEQGFRAYAACFVSGPDVGQLRPAHPFDSHPILSDRLQAVGMPLASAETQALLATASDGRWYQYFPSAEQMEKEQWSEYEEGFRRYHEQSLPYRFLPETAEEYEIVAKSFPQIQIAGRKGVLTIDHEKMGYDDWPEPIRYAEIIGLTVNDNKLLQINCQGQGKYTRSLKLTTFPNQQEVLSAVSHYYGRYQAAAEYQKIKKAAHGNG